MTLLLSTPEQHGFQDLTLELDEKKLSAWLSELPVLNTGESIRMVMRALEPLNEQQLGIDKRLRLLRLYEATVRRLYDSAEPLRLRQQPLSPQQRQDWVDQVERLCLAMADGFKIAVKALYDAGGQEKNDNRYTESIRGALLHLVAALVHSYRFYRPEPQRLFLELNQLYRLARQESLHDRRLPDEANGIQISLAGVYQAACLLALIDPFSAREGDADRYYQALLHYAPSARMVPGNSWQGLPEGLYFIDLQSDSRPRHCVFLDSPVRGEEPCILDARVPLNQMHKTLLALPAERRRQRAEAAILRALMPELPDREQRRSERRPEDRWIEVVVGLAPIGRWLQQRRQGHRPPATRWRVKDRSEHGYCLAWGDNAATVLQVGDLVCIVADSESESQKTQLLAVRWLRVDRERGAELGVEKLEGVPEAATIVVEQESGPESSQALLLTAEGGEASAARLVTPPQVYREQRSLLLYAGEQELRVRCTERIEETARFDCFEFQPDSEQA
jgi:hypothetical protein